MAASFLKRKPKEPERPQRVETPAVEADPELGLTGEQVHERLAGGWDNRPVEPPGATVQQIIVKNVCTYFNFLFFLLAGCVIAVRQWLNLTFLGPVFCNMFIGIVQDLRVKKKVDNLRIMSAPKCRAVRDGQIVQTEAAALVRDDIAVFGPGDQIPADAVVAAGECRVNEALVTGEADEIVKRPGDALLSGSFVVSGSCRARLTKVGADSFVSRLTTEARQTGSQPQSEMMRSLTSLIKWIGFLVIPLGAVMFIKEYLWLKSPVADAVTSTVGSIVGMIPEGLYLLASVALVVSVMRLASRKVLVHDMKCIEALARVDVLCVDKTGTITENEMQVSGVIPLAGFDPSQGRGLKSCIGSLVAAMPEGNVTMQALKRYFKTPGDKTAQSVVPFSSAYKYCAAVYEEESDVLGAPEFVLREDFEEIRGLVESYSADGYRVLVFGKYDGTPDGQALTGKVTPMGLILLENPIRRDAPETFRYFADQGVTVKVISGDNPLTVSQIALEAGIAGAERCIDASTLDTEEALREAATQYTVFGRVTPEQKRQLVHALQDAGHTVGMTGDGVNDVLALKDADCSVAMASGCDAAAQVSQLVLLESDFSAMPSVVLEGRRVVNNIQRSASLFLVKNIFSFLMAVFSACFALNYPLEPSQMSLISMFTIGIPGFFLALQPNSDSIQGRFLQNVLRKALPAGLTDFVVVGALVIFGRVFGVDEGDISTACTMLLAIVGFMILYHISKPMNPLRWCILEGSIVGLLVCSIWLGDIFGIQHMSVRCVMLFCVFAIVTEPMLRYSILAVEKLDRLAREHFSLKKWFHRQK